MHKMRIKILDTKRQPPKDAEIPFSGLPINIGLLPNGSTLSRPTAASSDVRLQNL